MAKRKRKKAGQVRGDIVSIATEDLIEAPWNVHRCDDEIMDRLTESVRRFGVIENEVVRPIPSKRGQRKWYEVVSGNHRLRIYKALGIKAVPCMVVKLDDGHARLLAQTLNNTRGKDDRGLADALYAALSEMGVGDEEVQALLPEEEIMSIVVGEEARTTKETILDQAVQLIPSREYVVVMCGPGEEGQDEWEALKTALGLKPVRRGGYKKGSDHDQVGTQRVIRAADLLRRLEA